MNGADPLRGSPCLVLGAGGFLGGHLCRELLRRGARWPTMPAGSGP